MPIDTSIITGTKAHKHTVDSAEGGFLSSTETGMTNLTEGGIIQGSAANIQTNLTLGTQSQLLRVNALQTALEYYTPETPSTVYWELLDQHDVANDATESDYTKTFSPSLDMIDGGDYNQLYVLYNLLNVSLILINIIIFIKDI